MTVLTIPMQVVSRDEEWENPDRDTPPKRIQVEVKLLAKRERAGERNGVTVIRIPPVHCSIHLSGPDAELAAFAVGAEVLLTISSGPDQIQIPAKGG